MRVISLVLVAFLLASCAVKEARRSEYKMASNGKIYFVPASCVSSEVEGEFLHCLDESGAPTGVLLKEATAQEIESYRQLEALRLENEAREAEVNKQNSLSRAATAAVILGGIAGILNAGANLKRATAASNARPNSNFGSVRRYDGGFVGPSGSRNGDSHRSSGGLMRIFR